MAHLFYLALFIFSGITTAIALHQPSKSPFDTRIRYTPYNAHDVVQLDTVIGIATHVVLEEGEQYMTHAFGDAKAYAFAVKKNHLFLKPRAENADTNLTVVTDRRSYHFRLTFKPTLQASAVYQLNFTYPDSMLRDQKNKHDRSALEKGFKQKGPYHFNYTMSGDEDIAPLNAWDNGTFTYFKFTLHKDLPVIYMVDEDGLESMVNRHSMGEGSPIMVVHKVHPRWVLRLGNRALAIYNEGYTDHGMQSTSGTAVPKVQRKVKDEHLQVEHSCVGYQEGAS